MYGWEHTEGERKQDPSDNFAAQKTIEDDLYHKDLLGKIPWNVVFGNLSDDEKNLARLFLFDDKTSPEVAKLLQKSEERVARDWNKLRAKIRARVKSITKGTVLENALPKRRAPSKRAKAREPQAAPAVTEQDGLTPVLKNRTHP